MTLAEGAGALALVGAAARTGAGAGARADAGGGVASPSMTMSSKIVESAGKAAATGDMIRRHRLWIACASNASSKLTATAGEGEHILHSRVVADPREVGAFFGVYVFFLCM